MVFFIDIEYYILCFFYEKAIGGLVWRRVGVIYLYVFKRFFDFVGAVFRRGAYLTVWTKFLIVWAGGVKWVKVSAFPLSFSISGEG